MGGELEGVSWRPSASQIPGGVRMEGAGCAGPTGLTTSLQALLIAPAYSLAKRYWQTLGEARSGAWDPSSRYQGEMNKGS